MRYREDHKATEKYKREYLNGINHIIECRQRDAQLTRNKYIKDIFKNQEEYRDDLKTMLGWPLVENDTNKLPDVTTEKLSDEDGYSIYRMQFEILDGLKLTGLFFKMDGEEKILEWTTGSNVYLRSTSGFLETSSA